MDTRGIDLEGLGLKGREKEIENMELSADQLGMITGGELKNDFTVYVLLWVYYNHNTMTREEAMAFWKDYAKDKPNYYEIIGFVGEAWDIYGDCAP